MRLGRRHFLGLLGKKKPVFLNVKLRTVGPSVLYLFNQQLIAYTIKLHFSYIWLRLSGLSFPALQSYCDSAKDCFRAQCFLPRQLFICHAQVPPCLLCDKLVPLQCLATKCFLQQFLSAFYPLSQLPLITWAVEWQCVPLSAFPVLHAEGKSSGYRPFRGAWKSILG